MKFYCEKTCQEKVFIFLPCEQLLIQKDVWIRWTPDSQLKNSINIATPQAMLIEFAAINTIEWYSFVGGKPENNYSTGTRSRFDSRPFIQNDFAFPVQKDGKIPDQVYLRLQATNALVVPIKIVPQSRMLAIKYTTNLLWGGLFGLVILMSFINFFLYVLLRKVYHLYYTAYTLCVGLTLASLSGHGFLYLWSNRPDVNGFSIAFFTCMMIFFGLLFSLEYLSRGNIPVKLVRFTEGLAGVSLSVAIASIFLDYDMAFLAAVVASFFAPLAAYLGIRGIQTGIVGAKIYTAAWMFYLLGVAGYALTLFQLIEANMVIMHLKEVGATVEILLLSIGVAVQMKNAMVIQNQLQAQVSSSLRERNEALKRSAKIKDDFFIMITHELRTPMNGIVGSLENIRGAENFQVAQEAFVMAQSSANEMLDLVDSLLLYQEMTTGDVHIDTRPIKFERALLRTVAFFEAECRDKGLQFQFQPQGSLPQFLLVDDYKLFGLLRRLLDNAIKFTDNGRVILEVGYTDHPTGVLEFSVIDTGIGIEPHRLAELFQPFAQADSGLTRQAYGLGLGLVLAKGLVELLKGKLEVESTVHCGTLVRVRVPVMAVSAGKEIDFHWQDAGHDYSIFTRMADDARHGEVELSTEERFDAPVTDAKKVAVQTHKRGEKIARHVLVVEDNPTNALMMKAFLKRLGHTFVHAVNGALAVSVVASEHVDIIFMDLQMPVMDGFEATSRIRELEVGTGKRTPIIACTANATMNTRRQCLEAGMDGFLSKPIKASMLESHIDSCFSEKESAAEPPINVVDFHKK